MASQARGGATVIQLGLRPADKPAAIARALAAGNYRRAVILSPEKFRFPCDELPVEWIEWGQVIQYTTYYRLLQEIDRSVLVVVNECLRTQARHDLTYNCMRLFIAQAGASLVLQFLPIIDTPEDFAILFDFATRSQWRRSALGALPLGETPIEVRPVVPTFRAVPVETDDKLRAAYAREKRKLIDEIGLRDPHTIPRNLHLMAGRAKLAHVAPGCAYVGRNDRFKAGIAPYKSDGYPRAPYTVFEWPHNFVDFSDVIGLSGQSAFDVLTSDLRVDGWYFDRYTQWAKRIADAYAIVRR